MKYDATVVGSGPNGLAAAITLQHAGVKVLLLEAKETIGGGMRTSNLTLPGYLHDVCSAVHPMALLSPFFRKHPFHLHGLSFVQPTYALAHPLKDGAVAIIDKSLEQTAKQFDQDANRYAQLLQPLVDGLPELANDLLAPLQWPDQPIALLKFARHALLPATKTAAYLRHPKAQALWAGIAAHAILPLDRLATSSISMVLAAAAHKVGWPLPVGGSQQIANTMATYFTALGGTIETGKSIGHLTDLPAHKAVLFDLTPRQILKICGEKLSGFYQWQLNRYRYGMGVFKIDWALDDVVPFIAKEARMAGTLHLGGHIAEIVHAENETYAGRHPTQPFVLFSQPSLFDTTRAPAGKHTAWAYCHVPHGSTVDMTKVIEMQVERFAPGFKERILARHTMHTGQMQTYNANYIGGDINGGEFNIHQLFTRPALRLSPYRTSAKGIYVCSSSTPPGGGVHGMCGYHAAKTALSDIFGIRAAVLR